MREKNRVRMESIRKWEAAKNMDENMYCSFRKKLKDATLSAEERKMYEELVRKSAPIKHVSPQMNTLVRSLQGLLKMNERICVTWL